jgi:hypothetical protein
MIEKYSTTYYQANDTIDTSAMDTSSNNELVHTDAVVDDVPVTKKAKIEENNSKQNIKIEDTNNLSSTHTVAPAVEPIEANESATAAAPVKTRVEIRHDQLLDELSKPDAVFEPNTLNILQELSELNANSDTIAKTLAKSYVGSSQVIPILLAWSELAKQLQHKSTTPGTNDDSEKLVRKMCNEELSILIKQRFSKEKADAILPQVNAAAGDVDEVEWLETLLEEAVFRKMFIHLYNVHITSKFLHKVVKMISDKVRIHLPR